MASRLMDGVIEPPRHIIDLTMSDASEEEVPQPTPRQVSPTLICILDYLDISAHLPIHILHVRRPLCQPRSMPKHSWAFFL